MQGQQHNTLWNQARQWQANAGNQRPSNGLSGLKLVAAWLIGGVVMIFSLFAALVMMVLGIIMLPFIRRRIKKAHERDAAAHAGGPGQGQWPPELLA